ncbi:MAG: histidine phosphatase family protein [Pirellulales bacterium]
MNPKLLKSRVQECLWRVAEADDAILSATLAGSFVEEATLEGVSDIDLILVVDHLDRERFARWVSAFDSALRGELAACGYGLRINPTLGPLKFNDPATAVLHLMLYSRAAHVEHAIASPFTCFDWQRSTVHCKRSLAAVFPVFNLQPHHFMSARRGVREYLRDFHAHVVSYRELDCTADGYHEVKCTKAMNVRDRHEFAYHVMRFLMQNLVKLVRRANLALRGETLLGEYFLIFPEREPETRRLFKALRTMKRRGDFSEPLADLDRELPAFVDGFEAQFRRRFFTEATRHVAFRHGPTLLNRAAGQERVFLGRSDPPLAEIDAQAWQSLVEQLAEVPPAAAYTSPLLRCRQSLAAVAERCPLPALTCDERLREIDYGALEGLTVASSRATHGGLFAAWERGEDPKFPGGENSRDVAQRALAFACHHWQSAPGHSVTCTHNVVLRCLVGHVLGLEPHEWHRLEVPHLAPITFVATREHGLFVDIPTATARVMFQDFATLSKAA